MRSSTRALLAPLLVQQDSVVTARQLRSLGVDPELPRREGWTRLAPRTWCAQPGAPTDEQLLQGAALHAGPGAVPSGALACRRHGLRDVPATPGVDVLIEHGRRLRSSGLTVVRQTERMPVGVRRQGWRVAPADRAVADAARWSGDLRLVRALVLAAVDDRVVSLEDLATEHAAGQQRGRAVLGRVLDDGRWGARSAPEAEVADALTRCRLPPLLLNPRLHLAGVLLGSPDGYLPGLATGWEVDSVRHHGSSASLAATLARHRRFADAGIELVHVVPGEFRRDPHGWADRFAARVRARAACGVSDPAGLLVVPHDAVRRAA